MVMLHFRDRFFSVVSYYPLHLAYSGIGSLFYTF